VGTGFSAGLVQLLTYEGSKSIRPEAIYFGWEGITFIDVLPGPDEAIGPTFHVPTGYFTGSCSPFLFGFSVFAKDVETDVYSNVVWIPQCP
jgi:hypothetical protein